MSKMHKRYLVSSIQEDLKKKMVFVGGPRQVGKTTLSKSIRPSFGYLNWDSGEDRERILRGQLPNQKLLIFDEIHKYRGWRNWLKGKFDTLRSEHDFLVTGSARLDFYRFSGDSLQGRYFYFRLHPLSVAELGIRNQAEFTELLNLSGFPEPFFSSSKTEYKRWSRSYRTRLFREDVTSLERVDDLGTMELLALRLPELVGSPLSINALREDLQVSHKRVARYVEILERVYSVFRIAPFGSSKIRAVKKEQKHYQYDWASVVSGPQRLENLVASNLLKWVNYREDVEGVDTELRYFRDSDGREVDFVVTEDKKPILFIEVKSSGKAISPNLRYLKAKYPEVRAFQLHAEAGVDFLDGQGIRSCPAWVFLRELV
jgi:predicted AAA+ superfamily ATPase